MRHAALAIATLGLALLASCKSEPGGEGEACTKKEDCAEGLSCVDNVCTKLGGEPAVQPSAYCETVAALAGTWTFDTTVIGAEDLAPRGINGHYEMTVAVDNCTANLQLIKTGYDDVKYAEKKVQSSDAVLAESKQIPGAAEATVSLKGKPTHTMIFQVRDGQLFGFWQSTGDEWARAGMWGFLRGVQKGQDLAKVEDFAAQPCEVACLTQCDTARRRADATLDEPSLAACLTACSAGEPIVGCGPGKPLPAELMVAVAGPVKTIDELCAKVSAELLAGQGSEVAATAVTCDRKPPVNDKPASRSLNKAALAGSFNAAELVQVSWFDAGFYGWLILALETEAGWYWTKPLMDMSSSGVGGVSSTTTSLVLRARELLSPAGREVVAELAMQTTDSDLGINEVALDEQKYVVVCSTGAPPVCVEATIGWSSERTLIDDKTDDPKKHPDLYNKRGELYVSFLPGDLVSISVPEGAREEDRKLSGIFAWRVE
ncbi:MAG TPA: hypothetical protein VM869_29070 [Enhygromyxa sp.]|nr:hypothetical protein [Enhygromyxa sp.]